MLQHVLFGEQDVSLPRNLYPESRNSSLGRSLVADLLQVNRFEGDLRLSRPLIFDEERGS